MKMIPSVILMGLTLASSALAAYTGPYKTVGPIWTDQPNIVIENVHIENPNGDCIHVGGPNSIIRNVDIGPCGNRGIHMSGFDKAEIVNANIHDITTQGISVENVTNATVHYNTIVNASTTIYAAACKQLDVSYNYLKDIRGDKDIGHAIIFNQVRSDKNRANCNKIVNDPANTGYLMNDVINMFMSAGTAEDPLQVNGNRINGGSFGKNTNGSGILMGDGGGFVEWMTADDNVVHDAAANGMEIFTGDHVTLTNNWIYGSMYFANQQGLAVMNYYWDSCSKNPAVAAAGKSNTCNCTNMTVTGNHVWFQGQRFGTFAHTSTDGNCGDTQGQRITDAYLAANNIVGDIADLQKFPSTDTVRPSCVSDAGVGMQPKDSSGENPPVVDPPVVSLTPAEQCGAWQAQYNLIPYVSWGSTPEEVKPSWEALDCNHRVCQYFKDKYAVILPSAIGASPSMGTLPDDLQNIWKHPQVNCDDYLKPSCTDFIELCKKSGICKL